MLRLKTVVKAMMPPRQWDALKAASELSIARADKVIAYVERKGLRTWRSLFRISQDGGIDFAMLCIRRPVYLGLAVASINSLHFRNHRHRVLLHLDSECKKEFEKRIQQLDYPRQVDAVLVEDDPEEPWQFTKLEIVLWAASRGIPFVDADSRWHADPAPLIVRDRVTFLAEVNRFEAVAYEKTLITKALGHPDWASLRHLNTGFIAMPASLFSEQFAKSSRAICREIHEKSAHLDFSPEQARILRHTCEEVALSLAAQAVIGVDRICTLKSEDGPGNRNLLESYYYGALNKVIF